VNQTGSGGQGGAAVDAVPRSEAVPRLAVKDIRKSYGVVQALLPASFQLDGGEVHALVGENGSGKSTVVGILSGVVRPDAGVVTFGGAVATGHTPWESQRAGTQTVFQDGSLIGDLSVAQNLYLGTPAKLRSSYRSIEDRARAELDKFGLGRIDPEAQASSLSPGDRQLLDIARALMARPAVLLLDEATSALDAAGVDVALDLMRKAAADGIAVLFVTHRLSEVFRVADKISVLRDGAWQGTRHAEAVDVATLVELMAGTSVNVEFPTLAPPEAIGEPLLTAKGLKGTGYGPVDIEIRRGEIVGIAGADANGQLPLLRGLTGIDLVDGTLEALGSPIRSFQAAVHSGVAFLSSDRRRESLFPSLAIRENLVSGVLGRLAHLGYVNPRRERAEVSRSVDEFGIRLGSAEDPVTSLSGGNQQKVALSRVLVTKSRVILIDEPTQGVDVRSRIDIYHMLRDAAAAGAAVVVVSSDAAELAGLCDRIVVMSRGRVVAELAGVEATEESVIRAFTGVEQERQVTAEPEALVTARTSGLRTFLRVHQDAARLILVVLVLVAIGLYAEDRNSTFLKTASLYNIMLLALPLSVVAAAQFFVMFTGGIDVSVGANMGVTVALMSFAVQKSGVVSGLFESLALAVGIGLVIGTVNSVIVERIRIPPVIATIATLGILQGTGLLIRPQAAGTISTHVTNALTKQVGAFPVALIVVAVLFVFADVGLRSSGRGLRFRAVGLQPVFAFRLGENAPRLRQLSYIGCAILAAIGGVLLAAQVGTGDSTVGNQYTLLAVAAPILGGASLLGGRGSFVGCLVGALLLAMSESLPTLLNLGDGTSYLLTGGLTLAALLIYTTGAWAVVRSGTLSVRARLRGQGAFS
jgi:ribose transport system ATP-binding protein